MTKRKKSHGGLKFLAFLVVVGGLITGIVVGSKSETGQRIFGNREDRRLENTALTPRFAYASAKVTLAFASISVSEGAPEDFTLRRDISIDRKSATSSTEVRVGRTPTQVSPGVDAIPFDDFLVTSNEILTKDYQFNRQDSTKPWFREALKPYYYGLSIDAHYIPMIDDIMGYELRSLPAKAVTSNAIAGFKRANFPAVDAPPANSSVTQSYSYEMDLATYRRAIPILAGKANFSVPSDTPVTVTIGFDDVGLLRFADVAIASSTATTAAQSQGPDSHIVYHFTMEVTDISGEPIDIDIPTDIIEDPPADSVPVDPVPVDPAPVDTVPTATP